jgi:hypothetical protein
MNTLMFLWNRNGFLKHEKEAGGLNELLPFGMWKATLASLGTIVNLELGETLAQLEQDTECHFLCLELVPNIGNHEFSWVIVIEANEPRVFSP